MNIGVTEQDLSKFQDNMQQGLDQAKYGNGFIGEVTTRVTKTVADIGRVGLSALYPNDFEVYLMSLELVKINKDGVEETEDYFSFPVMPNNINQSEPQITNIKKTAGGISIISANTFIPKEVSIQGNFGRSFKILIKDEPITFKGLLVKPASLNIKQGVKGISDNIKEGKLPFDNTIKTGYGCIKILQSIADRSTSIENGHPKRLFFHNPAFGESHLIKITNFTASQSMQTNMIWNYNLSFKLISSIQNIRGVEDKSLKKSLRTGMVQNKVNGTANFVTKVLAL